MTSRRDVLQEINHAIEANGILPLSLKEAKLAQGELERDRLRYEASMRKVMSFDLALYYRVAVFGSARLGPSSSEFQFVSNLTRALVEARDVDIVTGGGPGIMEAANAGARRAINEARVGGRRLKAKNHGETIVLPSEQNSNGHLHFERRHSDFPTRLQAFLARTRAAYNAEGGIGTLFEMLLLTQARQVDHLEKPYPILAHPYWEPVVNAWNNAMYHKREDAPELINEADLKLIRFSANIDEIVDIISKDYDRWYETIRSKVRFI